MPKIPVTNLYDELMDEFMESVRIEDPAVVDELRAINRRDALVVAFRELAAEERSRTTN